jgi:predicted RNA-binding Zn-ribbon protein involved in translation (DUF1610 family)
MTIEGRIIKKMMGKPAKKNNVVMSWQSSGLAICPTCGSRHTERSKITNNAIKCLSCGWKR